MPRAPTTRASNMLGEVEWDRLQPDQCLLSLELLLEDSRATSASLVCIHTGVAALLSHASVCYDIDSHTTFATVVRDASMSLPDPAAALLQWLPQIPCKEPYIHILPALLCLASPSTIDSSVLVLEDILSDDSSLLLPVLLVLCDMHDDSTNITLLIRSLIQRAIDCIDEDKLDALLLILAKCSRFTPIDSLISSLHTVLCSLPDDALEPIIIVLFKIIPTNTLVAEALYRCINSTLTDLPQRPVRTLDCIVTILGFACTHSKPRFILTFWMRSHLSSRLYDTLHRVIDCQLAPSAAKAMDGFIWRVVAWMVRESALSRSVDRKQSSPLLANIVCVLYTSQISLRETIVHHLIASVFAIDDAMDDASSSLPPLGEALDHFVAKLAKRSTSTSMKLYSLAELSVFILDTLSALPVVGAAVGSCLHASIVNKLAPNDQSLVALLPKHILTTVFDLIIRAAAHSTELESSSIILVQKLLGSHRELVFSTLSLVVQGAQVVDARKVLRKPDACSDDVTGSLHSLQSIGVMIASSFLRLGACMTEQDRMAIVSWLAQRIDSTVDDSLVDVVSCLRYVLVTHSKDNETDILSVVRSGFNRLFQFHSILSSAKRISTENAIELSPSFPVANGAPHVYRLECIAEKVSELRELQALLPGRSDVSKWCVFLKELCELLSVCAEMDAIFDQSSFLELSSHALSCVHQGMDPSLAWGIANPSSSAIDVDTSMSNCIEIVAATCVFFGRHIALIRSCSVHMGTTETLRAGDVSIPSCTLVLLRMLFISREHVRLVEEYISKPTQSSKQSRHVDDDTTSYYRENCLTLHGILNKLISSISPSCLELTIRTIAPSDASHDSVFSACMLSMYACLTDHSISIHSSSDNSVCALILSKLDASIHAIEELRKSGDFEYFNARASPLKLPDMRENNQCIVHLNSVSVSLGEHFAYEDYVLHAILSFCYVSRLACEYRSRFQNLPDYCCNMREDSFLRSVASLWKYKASLSRVLDSSCSVCLVYSNLEHCVKLTQDSTVAMAGYKTMHDLSIGTNISSRCTALAFLISTLVFTNHSPLNTSSCAALELVAPRLSEHVLFTSLSNDFTIRHSTTSSSKLAASMFKLLMINSSSFASNKDAYVSLLFFMSWWLHESDTNRLAGLNLLLQDALLIFEPETNNEITTRTKRSGKSIGDSLSSVGVATACSIVSSPQDASSKTPIKVSVMSSADTSSQQTKKTKRTIVIEEEMEMTSAPIKQAKGGQSARRSLEPKTKAMNTFTSMTVTTAHLFFEVALSLLPFSLENCRPLLSSEDSYRRSQSLFGGPYRDIILGLMVSVRNLQQLMLLIKEKNSPKFLLDIAPASIRSISCILDFIPTMLTRTAEWRNQQGSVNVNSKADAGSLHKYAILCGWSLYLVKYICSYLDVVKEYFINEGTFELPKSFSKLLVSNQLKASKSMTSVQETIDMSSISVLTILLSIETYCWGSDVDAMEEFLRDLADTFKSKLVATSEADIGNEFRSSE